MSLVIGIFKFVVSFKFIAGAAVGAFVPAVKRYFSGAEKYVAGRF